MLKEDLEQPGPVGAQRCRGREQKKKVYIRSDGKRAKKNGQPWSGAIARPEKVGGRSNPNHVNFSKKGGMGRRIT